MEYLKLNNGITMPVLGFGTFMLNGESCEEAVLSAIKEGYRMIDTAEAYGNEVAVGNAIVKSGIARKELFLVTKVNYKSYVNVRETVTQSLKKLHTDYIDLLLLHWPFANYYNAWRELEKLYEEGKLRAIGVSNFEPGQLVGLIAYNRIVPAIDQIETNLYCQRVEERKWLDKKNVAHMAYAPLGQGNRNEMFSEPEVTALAEKYQKSTTQILLRFLTQKGIIVIPRSTKPEHIRENFDIFDFTLTEDELSKLTALDQKTALIGNPNDPGLVEMSLTW
ncbi:MAG: aldo/keto reductase [Lachnospiraceae bacterium]